MTVGCVSPTVRVLAVFVRPRHNCVTEGMPKPPVRSVFEVLKPQVQNATASKKKRAVAAKKPSETISASAEDRRRAATAFFAPRRQKPPAIHPNLLEAPRGDDTTTASRLAFERSLGTTLGTTTLGTTPTNLSEERRSAKIEFRPATQQLKKKGSSFIGRALPLAPPDAASAKASRSYLSLNAAQRAVVDASADACAVVVAGAGSGKTHSIVQRVRAIVDRGEVQEPSEILLMTFSCKASAELSERVDALFHTEEGPPQKKHGVVTKTFHGLAFAWLGRYHRYLGFERRPSPITDAGKRKVVKLAILNGIVEPKRIMRCGNALKVPKRLKTWADVLSAYEKAYPQSLDSIRFKAKATILAHAKKKKKKKKPKKKVIVVDPKQQKISFLSAAALLKKNDEELDDIDEDFSFLEDEEEEKKEAEEATEAGEAAVEAEVRRQVYMVLLKRPVDDLIEKYLSKEAVKEYVKFVETAASRGDGPRDYLAEEANVLKKFDEQLIKDNAVTFDRMLQHFEHLLSRNVAMKRAFAKRHRVIIVDEFQDNNRLQSKLLSLMMDAGCRSCMCVGDDDQAIYSFQGADVGNFDRFQETCRGRGLSTNSIALELNYRSSSNVVKVGRALLTSSTKTLTATKPIGEDVTLLECYDGKDQAKNIVDDLLYQKKTKEVPYKEMAVLFRCFKAGKLGRLHHSLQRELCDRSVPFQVVGSTSLFQQKLAQDLLAYVTLAVDDNSVAFSRVFNSPPRRLSEKIATAVEAFAKAKDCSLETAANTMTGLKKKTSSVDHVCVLTNAQKNNLRNYLGVIADLRKATFEKPISELVEYIWTRAGFAAYETKRREAKAKKRKKQQEEEDNFGIAVVPEESDDDDEKTQVSDYDEEDDDEEEEDQGLLLEKKDTSEEATVPSSQRGKRTKREEVLHYDWPESAQAVRVAAKTFAEAWMKDRESVVDPRSLFGLAMRCAVDRASELPIPAAEVLPPHLLELFTLPRAVGPTVASSFVANVALQAGNVDEEDDADDDRVVLSTIHRAKGKEWQVVCVPYFNEGLMPCEYREDVEPRGGRHLANCPRRRGNNSANCQCYKHFQSGTSPETQHYDEEGRLAHVAATRAKDWLRFYKVQVLFPAGGNKNFSRRDDDDDGAAQSSRFEPRLISSGVKFLKSTSGSANARSQADFTTHQRDRDLDDMDAEYF